MYRKLAVLMVVVATALVAVGYGTRGAQAAAPVANTGGPYAGTVGVPVQFTGAASTGDNLSFFWNFGDYTTGVGVAPSHVYNAAGTYIVTLTVTDMWGFSAQATTAVSISGGGLPIVAGPNCYWTIAGWVCGAAPVVTNCVGALYQAVYSYCAGDSYAYTGTMLVNYATTAQMCAWYQWYFAANYRLCRMYLP